jgi:isocitrate dehydrogenase (NAD+)
MLQHLGEPDAAHALFEAVRAVIGAGKRVTYDLGGTSGTRDMGDAIAEEVARLIG